MNRGFTALQIPIFIGISFVSIIVFLYIRYLLRIREIKNRVKEACLEISDELDIDILITSDIEINKKFLHHSLENVTKETIKERLRKEIGRSREKDIIIEIKD